MRSLQALPESPATQPYNEVKSSSNNLETVKQVNNTDTQNRHQQNQSNGTSLLVNQNGNPFELNIQASQQVLSQPEEQNSPIPEYISFEAKGKTDGVSGGSEFQPVGAKPTAGSSPSMNPFDGNALNQNQGRQAEPVTLTAHQAAINQVGRMGQQQLQNTNSSGNSSPSPNQSTTTPNSACTHNSQATISEQQRVHANPFDGVALANQDQLGMPTMQNLGASSGSTPCGSARQPRQQNFNSVGDVMNPKVPVSPPHKHGASAESYPSGDVPYPAQQPISPASVTQYNAYVDKEMGPHASGSPNSNLMDQKQEEEVDDDFCGPPMGTGCSMQQICQQEPAAITVSSFSAVAVVAGHPNAQYDSVVSGMGCLIIHPGQQVNQNSNNDYQKLSQHTQCRQGLTLQQHASPYQQPDAFWESEWQQQHQADIKTRPGWNTVPQQPPLHTPNQGYCQYGVANPNSFDIPALAHQSVPRPYDYTVDYDQNVDYYNPDAQKLHKGSPEVSSPIDLKPYNPVDDHKSSADVARERGAGIRAIRLLEATTGTYSPSTQRRGAGVSPGLTARQAAIERYQKAKQEKERLKAVEKERRYQQVCKPPPLLLGLKKPELLAESTRPVKNTRRGYDPELNGYKCQLDFDRQRGAQLKALKLMNANIF
jgi:hypothetical protein